MMISMTRVKIAVSLPPELVEAAKNAVASGKAASVSGYVEAALTAKVEDDDLGGWLDRRLEETGGPLTEEEIAWADAALGH